MTTARRSNWGRWGSEDQRGTLNLLTPDVISRAAGLVKKGKVYNLGVPVERTGPVTLRRNPTWHLTTTRVRNGPGSVSSADDILLMHTHAGTHVDALCHVWYEDQLYNGYSYKSLAPEGSEKNAITNVPWIATRGVLLDVARYRKVECLGATDVVEGGELDACAKAQGVQLQRGDFVLVRTGWYTVFPKDPATYLKEEPGLGGTAVGWFAQHDLCGVGVDNWGIEIIPPMDLKVHVGIIRDLGGYLIENLDLEALGRDEVRQFFFVVAPLPITKGIGSPVNPLALV